MATLSMWSMLRKRTEARMLDERLDVTQKPSGVLPAPVSLPTDATHHRVDPSAATAAIGQAAPRELWVVAGPERRGEREPRRVGGPAVAAARHRREAAARNELGPPGASLADAVIRRFCVVRMLHVVDAVNNHNSAVQGSMLRMFLKLERFSRGSKLGSKSGE